MGLLYPFAVSEEETDFVTITKDSQGLTTINTKTYGLPYIFWAYAAAILMVILFMFLAIKDPVLKLIAVGDEVDAFLGYSLLIFLGLLPVGVFAFFFFEKRISHQPGTVTLQYRVFGLPVFTESHTYQNFDQFMIAPFMDSPNVARLKASESSRGFQNKGYFILSLKTDKGLVISIDRHSRKKDLEDLFSLLKKAQN